VATNHEATGPPPAGDGLTDEELAGDSELFAVLFDRHVEAVRGRVAQWLPGPIQRKFSVADVLQEVGIVAFQRLPEFEHRGPGSFRNWVLRIAQLKVQGAIGRYGRVAKRNVWLEVSRGARPATAAFAGGEPSPSQAAIAAELHELAQRALAALTDDQREVLRLVREERMPLRDVAKRIGRTHQATKKLHGRALRRLTEEFERLEGNHD
jgi:RNA polymerase sigma factor (sigma-70 family)